MSRSVNRIVTIGLVALLPACASMRHAAIKNTSKTFKTVVVDAGHGGKDSGAYRRYGPPEKVVALDVAQRLNRKLRESQLKTVMTRNSDVFIELNDRGYRECAEKCNFRQHTLQRFAPARGSRIRNVLSFRRFVRSGEQYSRKADDDSP